MLEELNALNIIATRTTGIFVDVPESNIAATSIQSMHQYKQLHRMPLAYYYNVTCSFASVIKTCQRNVKHLGVKQNKT